ncbi:MAG: BspA family leucine-rich repeat surface protein [Bacteroidota bacterium]
MKKCTCILVLVIIFFCQFLRAQNFITQWNLATGGPGATELTFDIVKTGLAPVNYTWQELSPGTATGSGAVIAPFSIGTVSITGLPAGAIIRLEIAPSNFEAITMNSGPDCGKLTHVEQWGSANWTSMQNAFAGCSNLQVTATDVPDLSGVSSMAGMFQNCFSLNSPANINAWNTAAVTNMKSVFKGASFFNQNIGSWNTAAVTNMASMFNGASAFNQNIGSWNTGAVTNMSNMFRGASAFNQNIGSWNTAAVTDMNSMFYITDVFNQNIGSWNTAAVTDMSFMFYAASVFNQNIGSWNTGAVTDMSYMFGIASVFNQNIGSWNTTAVTNMSNMFRSAHAFAQNIGMWNTAAVTDMSSMFYAASAFNQNIGMWNTAAVTNMAGMFQGATIFNQNISSWNTGAVTNMFAMFNGAVAFNQNIGSWNTSSVINTSQMFFGATVFNQDIGGWNTAADTTMNNMFRNAIAFNQDISSWNTGNVANMNSMFYGAIAFNQDIGSWNTAAVHTMNSMFQGSSAFNQDIGSWNTAAVKTMNSMFSSASAFNQNLGSWTLKPGVLMSSMLNNCGMDCSNYSATLIGWNTNSNTPNGRNLGALNLKYGPQASAARANLVMATGLGGKGWNITGDALIGVMPTFAPVATICSGGSLLPLPTTSGNGVTGTWSPALDNTTTQTYTFTPTAGQCSFTETLTITVNNLPDVTTSTNANVITVTEAGASYQWIDCNNSNTPIGGETSQSYTATISGDYAVIVSNAACTHTSACVNILMTGVTELQNSFAIVVYPNPVATLLNIETNAVVKNSLIYNLLGELVQTHTATIFSVAELASGVYILQVKTDKGPKQLRFIKE